MEHDETATGADALAGENWTLLLTALETGYFAVPRQTTLVELADRLEMTDTEASENLRRATATLLEAHRGDSSLMEP